MLVFWSFIHTASSQSQPAVNVTANRNKVLLGEQIEVKVQATVPAEIPVTDIFKLPDTIPHLEILQRSLIDSVSDGSSKLYSQSFVITGFDSGSWVFPAVTLKAKNKTYRSQPLEITIVPVQLKDSTYHDIREIIEVPPPKTDWWTWIAAVASAIILCLLAWLWWKSRRQKQTTAPEEPKHYAGALEEALQQLKALERESLPEKAELKRYYSELSGIVRTYIQKRFGVKALQLTTGELLVDLYSSLKKEQPGKLAELLRIADAVKFARFRPDTEQCRTDIRNAEIIIKEMDTLI